LPLDFKIRRMRAGELDTVLDLVNITSAPDIRYLVRNSLSHGPAAGRAGYAIVAEADGGVVAAASVTVEPLFPGTIAVRLAVSPRYRRRGIATAMANLIRDELVNSGDRDVVIISLRDDLPEGRAFAENYGLELVGHSVGYRYDLPYDETGLVRQADEAAARAAVIVRAASINGEVLTILDCFERCAAGMPLPYGQRSTLDLTAVLSGLPSDAIYLLAESPADHDPSPVGMTILVPQHDDNSWYTRFTGTDPVYRGRGIATALKTAALVAAHRGGASAVTTHNGEGNRKMRSLNEALAMKPDLGYWALSRHLTGRPARTAAA
jgi:GNAT superfamily N-acetyltransferase